MSPSLAVFLFCFFTLTQANSHSPRMTFTLNESQVESFSLPGQYVPVQILLEEQPDVVTSVGKTNLNFYRFKSQKTAVMTQTLRISSRNKDSGETKVVWKECTEDCDYNITVVHQREVNGPVFVCGTNGKNTLCCSMNLTEQSHECVPSEGLSKIQQTIREFVIKGGEHSLLTGSEQSQDLYITYSGAHECAGIHKFGSGRVGPPTHDKEQHYVGLVLSRRNDSSQNKIYAFYKQKNKDTRLDGDMWLSYVSQVCMSDTGGSKSTLQFSWTSLMNTRLFCGNPNTKQDFSELVDVATVHSDRWEETKVYALFRNEWGMSAVCVYTIGDIDNVFTTSPFKGSFTYDDIDKRRKRCVPDSTKISPNVLMRIKVTSEVEQWVQPVNRFGPVVIKHHNYTHIYVDASQKTANSHHQVVMFLSLNDGKIHKAVQNGSHSLLIAEYQPFNHSAHVHSLLLHAPSRKLYMNTRSELVQLDVANCARYGDTCEECVLSGDPYCDWINAGCRTVTHTLQDMDRRHEDVCQKQAPLIRPLIENKVMMSPQSNYFLSCPVSSHHAQYTWHHPGGTTPCDLKDKMCILLIENMGPSQMGQYECVAEEMGYSRVLKQQYLELRNTAGGRTAEPALWVCLVVLLVKSF
ncbi:semaphorin-7A-like [Nematolebias whitei]|uniref:semaphorin-7A-like n=1 Tax=Nematolebias whitei TaxID=451745 RepID=UPI0018989288|nr:semaphorin-7A-like [Nematolebias whitei]